MAVTSTIVEANRARPLRWWSAAQLDAAAQRLRSALQPWASDWGLGLDGLGARNAADGAGPSADQGQPLSQGAAWLHTEESAPLERLHRLLFGVLPPAVRVAPTLSDDMAGAAWSALLNALHAAFARPMLATAPALVAPARWSGHVRLEATVTGEDSALRLGLLLHPTAAADWCAAAPASGLQAPVPQRQPLQRIDHALADRSMRLAVFMAPVVLDLGSLQSLQIGDVLTLPHRLNQPLEVAMSGDAPGAEAAICQAHLGQRDGRLAIALSRRSLVH